VRLRFQAKTIAIETLRQPLKATQWLIGHAVTGGCGCILLDFDGNDVSDVKFPNLQ
jgi:hypothetical protein